MKTHVVLLTLLSIGLPYFANAGEEAHETPIWKDQHLGSSFVERIAIPIGNVSNLSRLKLESIIDGWGLYSTEIRSVSSEESHALAEVFLKDKESKVGVLFLGYCHLIPSVFVSDEMIQKGNGADKSGRKVIWDALGELRHQADIDRCKKASQDSDGNSKGFDFPKFSPESIEQLDRIYNR